MADSAEGLTSVAATRYASWRRVWSRELVLFAGAYDAEDGSLTVAVRPMDKSLTESEKIRALDALVSVVGKDVLEPVPSMKRPRSGVGTVAFHRAAASIDDELGADPAVEARVREVIGMTYRTLGACEGADVHLNRANELAGAAFGKSAEAARIEHELAILQWDRGKPDEALALARQSLATQDNLLRPLAAETLETRLPIPRIQFRSTPEAALTEVQAVVDGRQTTLPAGDPRTVEAENTLGKALILLDRHAVAVDLLNRSRLLDKKKCQATTTAYCSHDDRQLR